MASPPNVGSPSGISPPGPTPAPLPTKKRSSTLDVNAPNKRRKASNNSAAPTHPLRQTSFPPPESVNSPFPRSPSVDAMSHVSGSAVSGRTADGKPKKKRGRKPKNAQALADAAAAAAAADDAAREKTPSLLGGRAPSGAFGGDKNNGGGGEEEEEADAEMAVEEAETPTKEQEQEELRMRAMLYQALDSKQKSQYEVWRGSSIKEANVKRVVNATVSQSVQGQISSSVRAVTKVFAGELIELARQVQTEYVLAGEKQTDLPEPAPGTEAVDGADETTERRGPLRPEHLREAWRRYQRSGEGRGVGTQQLWHAQQGDGVDRFSTRTGKRLFR